MRLPLGQVRSIEFTATAVPPFPGPLRQGGGFEKTLSASPHSAPSYIISITIQVLIVKRHGQLKNLLWTSCYVQDFGQTCFFFSI